MCSTYVKASGFFAVRPFHMRRARCTLAVPSVSDVWCVASAQAINELGFATMTPVQAATIPAFISHKDVSVEVRAMRRAFRALS